MPILRQLNRHIHIFMHAIVVLRRAKLSILLWKQRKLHKMESGPLSGISKFLCMSIMHTTNSPKITFQINLAIKKITKLLSWLKKNVSFWNFKSCTPASSHSTFCFGSTPKINRDDIGSIFHSSLSFVKLLIVFISHTCTWQFRKIAWFWKMSAGSIDIVLLLCFSLLLMPSFINKKNSWKSKKIKVFKF